MTEDLLPALKDLLAPPEPAPEDGSKPPNCVCASMDPDVLARQGECYLCTLWRRADYRARWTAKESRPTNAPPASSPSLFAKAAHFARAVLRHAASGFERVSDEELAARLACCAACAHHAKGACALCGCNLAIKATWKSEACPISKWLQ